MELDIKRVLASAPRKHNQEPLMPLRTPWGDRFDPASVLLEHPRPQCARSGYVMLHGMWEYAIEHPSTECSVCEIRAEDAPALFDGSIAVPFSPEASLSGVSRQLQPGERLWYRLLFDVNSYFVPIVSGDGTRPMQGACEPVRLRVISALGKTLAVKPSQRCRLHFDAVDHECCVWLNGRLAAHNKGGYRAFCADVTELLVWGVNELLVCVVDSSNRSAQLRGKQQLERDGIWYTAQSGIWQSVWFEAVPQTHVQSLAIRADMHGDLRVEANTNHPSDPMTVALFQRAESWQTRSEEKAVYRFRASVDEDDVCKQVAVLHVENVQLWSPEEPNLYSLEVRCGDDKVQSYCAFRSVSVKLDEQGVARFHLNGKPYFLRGVLDQGYWPDGLMTAPSDEALAFDIATMKELGFNMLRKHIKVENERWYWHCDRLGMLVWQDVPSGGGAYSPWHISRKPTLFRSSWTRQRDDTPQGRKRLSGCDSTMQEEWLETCRDMVWRLFNHPCVATWVLFNEGWGQFDARDATKMVTQLDSSRPIDATSGWYDQGCGNYWSVHNYFRPLQVWPDSNGDGMRAFVISEFGGLNWHVANHSALERSYGYANFPTIEAWRQAVRDALTQADSLELDGLSGYVYTQLSDVEEETNGLLTYDRKINKLCVE
ncbi:MAG: glycoside hydrolase family 2 [Eggerthellaceae bacterium]|nr:glycoside hydrolase family 2 [Eggerthellaceae bacterium]